MAEKKNYEDANQYCKNLGARLFEPRSKTINKLIYGKSVEVFGAKFETWIGINDIINDGEYVFTSNGEKVTTLIWDSSQPNPGDEQDCIVIDVERWWDKTCNKNRHFICEFPQ